MAEADTLNGTFNCWHFAASHARLHTTTEPATSSATTPIKLSGLPASPETACASPDVKAAWAACLFGPSASCCSQLDAVFANRTSPSFG